MLMKLLLSSFGFNSPILREKFSKVIPQNETLQEKLCLVIPYAGFDTEKTFAREKQGLVDFGFNPQKVVFVKSYCDIADCHPDYIYVPGGNPFKLLQAIKEIGIMHEIVDCVKSKGATYIGVSAGADIIANSIAYVLQLEDNNEIYNEDFNALGLITESILCHYDHYSYSVFKACQEVSYTDILTINDDQLLKFENGIWEYAGEDYD